MLQSKSLELSKITLETTVAQITDYFTGVEAS